MIKINTKKKHKQNGIQHSVERTIHSAQEETSINMATEVSLSDSLFCLWKKIQIVVIIVILKEANNTIFVGD